MPDAAPGTPRCGNCRAPLPWVVESDDERFTAVVEESSLPVLVDVWAPWCGPCRMVTPALEHLAEQRAGELKLVKVNADLSPELSRRFEIRAIPTLLVMHGPQVLAQQTGAAPQATLAAWLDQSLASLGRASGAV